MSDFTYKLLISFLAILITYLIFTSNLTNNISRNDLPICVLGTFISLKAFMNALHHYLV